MSLHLAERLALPAATILVATAAYLSLRQPTPEACIVQVEVPSRVEVPVATPVLIMMPVPTGVRVRELPFVAKDLPTDMRYTGSPAGGVRWLDVDGEHVVVFSKTRAQGIEAGIDAEDSTLYATHFVRKPDGTIERVREIREHTGFCSDDIVSRFHAAHLVSDIDDDGLAELMFGYAHGACVTDMGDVPFKLFLVEGADKYVLRGNNFYEWHPHEFTRSADIPPVFAARLERYWPWFSYRFSSGWSL